MMAPGRRGRIIRRGILIAVAVAASLAMEISGFMTTPRELRPEVSYVTLHAMVPLIYAACAIAAWGLGPTNIPARMMVAFTVLWIPVTFFRVIEDIGWLWPILYGAHLWWAAIPTLLPLIYPRGRLSSRTDRWLVGIVIGVSLVYFFGAVLLSAGPSPERCDCAPNPYQLAEAPGVFAAIDLGYRVIGAVISLVIAVRLIRGWVRGSIPARAVAFIMPVALIAWTATLAWFAVTSALAATADAVILTVSLVSVAAIPLSFVAGVLHTRNMRSRVADLMRITREGADRGLWAESLARALRDESVRVYWWDDESGRYADAAGEPVDKAAVRLAGHGLLPVASPTGVPIALIRHDKVLTDNMRLLDGVSSALRLSVDNGRLRSEIERTLEQVRQSRQRIVEAGDEARRRIERDLHDGAQQQLVSLGMRLRLAANQARDRGIEPVGVEIDGNIGMLNQALQELRELAHGIHPSLLSSGGLALAVPELAGHCPVPIELDVQSEGRLPEVIESTAYFVVSEALSNLAKHAQATRGWVRAWVTDGELELSVRDNGVGGARAGGSGLLGIADRVEAVGGRLSVSSSAGAGTTIAVHIPLAAR